MGKDMIKRVNQLLKVQMKRNDGNQDIGFNSRPFVLCGLPYRSQDSNKWERKNGDFTLKIVGDPDFGLPYGQDRIIPIFLATKAIRQQSRKIKWDTAGEVLDLFGLSRAGSNYQLLIERFKRIFSATIHFGTEKEDGLVWNRFQFMDQMQLWFKWRDWETTTLPLPFEDDSEEEEVHINDVKNQVVLSEAFWRELQEHPIPIDIQAVRALTDSPGALDFYCWLVWRSWKARSPLHIPLEGEGGLFMQLGMKQDQATREKRRRIRNWLDRVEAAWKKCEAHLSDDGNTLVVPPGQAIQN